MKPTGTATDWSPGTYERFRGLRLRPATDLLARVPPGLPEGPIVDLGCGTGVMGAALRARFPDRELIGVDLSPAMLEKAASEGSHDRLIEGDIARWRPDSPPALIFSNAALNWVPGHATVFPGLAGLLARGGVLAVQMPDQQEAPSHRLLREVSARLFPDRFDWSGWRPEVMAPAAYHVLLSGHGVLEVWATEYLQPLAPAADGHPVRLFTEGTAARPILERLDADDRGGFLGAYDAALAEAYPPDADGAVLFPFRRLFLTLATEGVGATA